MGWDRDGGNATYSDILPGSLQTTNPTLLPSLVFFFTFIFTFNCEFGAPPKKIEVSLRNLMVSFFVATYRNIKTCITKIDVINKHSFGGKLADLVAKNWYTFN